MTRKELLAVVTFLHHFRSYLLGYTFKLRTDHSSLQWLQNFCEPEGHLARWLEQLQGYSFTIVHRVGGKNLNADAKSRKPSEQSQLTSQTIVDNSQQNSQHIATEQSTDEDAVETADDKMYMAQANDDVISPILQAKKTDTKPGDDQLKGEGRAVHLMPQQWDQLLLCNGLLYRKFEKNNGNSHLQLVVPKCKQEAILREVNAGPWGGHL